MAVKETGKAISTIALISSALDLFKSLAIVFTMTMLEYARKQKAKAEFERDKAKNDLEIEKETNEIKKESSKKSSPDIVAEFLKRP